MPACHCCPTPRAAAPPLSAALLQRTTCPALHAVCFGLAILTSLLCGAAFWRLRWHRTATALLWVLWLTIALLMLLGVGECCRRRLPVGRHGHAVACSTPCHFPVPD